MSNVITSTHGNGGRLTHKLIEEVFKKHLPLAENIDNDSCLLPTEDSQIVVTTDGHAIDPIFFPGGDIGKLSVTGTVNDLLASGAEPIGLSASFFMHEGLPLEDLEKIVFSMGKEMQENGMVFYSGDTKVVPSHGEKGLFISTTGYGRACSHPPHPSRITPGMDIICTGEIATHGVCLLGLRNDLEMTTGLESDATSLYPMMKDLFQNKKVACFRDATRGGLLSSFYELMSGRDMVVEIEESEIPINPKVRATCSILGLQPLEVANEGVAVIFCDSKETQLILHHLRSTQTGKSARKIGVTRESSSLIKVHVKTSIGGTRALSWTNAENLPRIC